MDPLVDLYFPTSHDRQALAFCGEGDPGRHMRGAGVVSGEDGVGLVECIAVAVD